MMDRAAVGNVTSRSPRATRPQPDDPFKEQWRRGGSQAEHRPSKQELLKDAVDNVNRLMKLPDGWDGRNARGVDPDVAVAMVRLINSLIDDGSADAQVSPLPDGGLVTEWLVGEDSLEARMHPGLRWSLWAEWAGEVDEVDAEFDRPGQGRAAIEQARIFLAKVSESVVVRRPRPR